MSSSVRRPTEDKVSEAARWCLRMAEGELYDLDRMQLDLWLQADPDNGRQLANAIEAWQAAKQQACEPEMIALRSEALADIQRAKVRRGWHGKVFKTLLATAAALVIGVGLSGLWLAQRPQFYVTNVGERRVIVLPDGSKLSLDALTRVKVRYTAERRQFWLESGRAKFDVAKNPLRPFTVAANGKLVVATGTQFSVELLPKQVRVDLYEGHVAVLNDHAGGDEISAKRIQDDQSNAQYLAAGQELITSPRSDSGVVRALDQADAPAWEAGQLIFVDERLSTVAERANRYSEQKIVLADPATGDMRISGVFVAGNTPAIVTAITNILPVRASDNDGTTTLSLDRTRNISQADGVRLER